MLQLGTGMQTIDGVTVFPDHADDEQFWYLPANISLARRPEDDRPQFTFIKYKRAATDNGVEGGGFLMFAVELALSDDAERAIRSQLPAGARLTAVPFDSGTVECVALNLQGSGGTVATVGDDGTFIAVRQILGARVPSLFGDNTAVFSLTLSAEGATLLEAAFAQGATPIGVIYNLKFTALQPALDVKITADFERIYQHFSAGLNANVYYVEVGIEVGLEELVQNGAIKIEVTNFTTSEDQAEQERAAIDFFKQHLLAAWFTPTLTPATLQGGMAAAPRAGGGAGLFGPGRSGGTGASAGGGDRSGQPTRPPTPPTPPNGPPAPPAPPAPPRPPGPGGPAAPGPTPAPAPGPTPPPTTMPLVATFREADTATAVAGRYWVSASHDGSTHELTTPEGQMAPELSIAIPATWRTCALSAHLITLPVLAAGDQDQLRSLFESGNERGVTASGTRDAPLGMSFNVDADLDPQRPSTYRYRADIQTTSTRITAASADALVAAVFPGGRLVQPGIYDVRRVSGTNDFALIGLGEIGHVHHDDIGDGS